MNNMIIYVVRGQRENVSQDFIGEPFVPHPAWECVKAFSKRADAEYYINSQKLSRVKRGSFSDTEYYKGGYYDMDIEEIELIS